jgi:transcriptional regulator with XRE-family HTH domain
MHFKKNKFQVELGNKIANKRKQKNYSQIEVALILGCSNMHISRIELGKAEPTLILLYKICSLLKCEITDLLPKVKNMNSDNFNCA